MNKISRILIAVMGGIDVCINIFTPIILMTIWTTLISLEGWKEYLFLIGGLLASLLRAIKIGWFK